MEKRFFDKPLKNNGIKFVIYPIVFFLLGLFVCYIAFTPIIKSFGEFLEIFLYAEAPSFDKNEESLMDSAVENGNIVLPKLGQQFAKIIIDSAGIEANIFYGDSSEELIKGVGCYEGAYIPGQKSTILLAAHNNTYFHNLGKISIGDKININTNYGKYVYEMTDSKVALESDSTAYDLYKNEENLILYTCYPFDTLGLTPNRYFVYAKYISGPQTSN